jgi:hypothetical protein
VPAFIERQQALIDGGLTRNRIRRVIISINQFSKCLWCGSNPPACRAVECTPFIGVGEWSIPGAGGSAPLLSSLARASKVVDWFYLRSVFGVRNRY